MKDIRDYVRELERAYAWRASVEMQYAATDTKRLREYQAGGITKKTAAQHTKVCAELERAHEECDERLRALQQAKVRARA